MGRYLHRVPSHRLLPWAAAHNCNLFIWRRLHLRKCAEKPNPLPRENCFVEFTSFACELDQSISRKNYLKTPRGVLLRYYILNGSPCQLQEYRTKMGFPFKILKSRPWDLFHTCKIKWVSPFDTFVETLHILVCNTFPQTPYSPDMLPVRHTSSHFTVNWLNWLANRSKSPWQFGGCEVHIGN